MKIHNLNVFLGAPLYMLAWKEFIFVTELTGDGQLYVT